MESAAISKTANKTPDRSTVLVVPPQPVPPWTAQDVAARLYDAMTVVARRPNREGRWLRGAGSTMPDVVRSHWECYGQQPAMLRLAAPSPARIQQMEEALGWLLWIDDQRSRTIVMARAARAQWKVICKVVGLQRRQAINRRNEALALIADRLSAGESVR